MKRKDFLRTCLMGLAVSLVPKILQPSLPELIEVDCAGYEGIIPKLRGSGAIAAYEQHSLAINELYYLFEARINKAKK